MFDAVRNNKRIVQVFLAVITIPFALWGVDSYIQSSARDAGVAKVGRSKITQQEFQQAIRDAQGRMREQMGPSFDPSMLQSPEFRESVIEDMISQRLVDLQLEASHMRAGPEALGQIIGSNPAFFENGQFSEKKFEQALAERGMSPGRFKSLLAQQLAEQQLLAGVSASEVVSMASIDRWLALQDEVREVEVVQIPLARFMPQVKLATDAARKDYDANQSRWQMPLQVKAEYLVLSQAALASEVTVSDDQVRKFYQDNPQRYAGVEERHVRHILIEAPKGASADKRKQARAKAEALLAQLRAKPERFAELAKANSQDTDSGAKGGDLGYMSRGGAKDFKAVEDAAFALKAGAVSDIVESDYGFHLVKLDDVRSATVKPFEQVKESILADLKKEAAAKRFAEAADSFTNTVYEQPDSLKPAADKYKLQVQQTPLFAQVKGLPPPFDNPKVLKAVFAPEAIKSHRNTEAMDLGDGRLISVRVIESKPASLKPFAEVRTQIEQQLTIKEAAKLASAEGLKQLAALKKGDAVALEWSKAEKVSRGKSSLPPVLAKPVFRASGKLPAYVGTEIPGAGYGIVRIRSIEPGKAPTADDPRRKAFAMQYGRLISELDRAAYFAALRARYTVKIDKAALEAKE
jgi:peptidyl-prolyl cis-trans isomerase D